LRAIPAAAPTVLAMTALPASTVRTARAALLVERSEILDQAAYLAADDAVLAASKVDGNDRIVSSGDADSGAVERSVIATLSAKNRQALADIDDALRRLDAGTYGVCSGCSHDIPAGRLEARPRTSMCVPCASARG
jgi:DnaK suppressor protein